MTVVLIEGGEYSHHRCDKCGAKGKGRAWTTSSPYFAKTPWSETSYHLPDGWTHFDAPDPKYRNRTIQCAACPACKET